MSQPQAGTLSDLRAGRPAALAALASDLGRQATEVAHLVLAERDSAEKSAVLALGDAWLNRVEDAWTASPMQLRRQVLVAAARHALAARARVRTIDASPDGSEDALAGLAGEARAAVALHLVAGLDVRAIAAALRRSSRRVGADLAAATERAGSAERLEAALAAALDRLPVTVDAEAVRRVLDERRPREWSPRRGHAVLAAAIAGVVAVIWIGSTSPTTEVAAPATPMAEASAVQPDPASRALRTGDASLRDRPISLVDCGIRRVGTRLAFDGWSSLPELNLGREERAGPVYVLVTGGSAEWVGWYASEGPPMYPRPIGRVGCVYDPATQSVTLMHVAASWAPPERARSEGRRPHAGIECADCTTIRLIGD